MSQENKKPEDSTFNFSIKGPSLQPKHNLPSRRARKHASNLTASEPSPSSSATQHKVIHIPSMELKKEESNMEHHTSPSKLTSTDTAPARTPIKSSTPSPSTLSYSPEEEPELIAHTYVHDLDIIHTTCKAGTPAPVPLCPFILAHLCPQIIPHYPLYIQSAPDYVFYLLYVLKETITSPSAQPTTSYIAVFSMTNIEQKTYITMGTSITVQTIDQINRNIQWEIVQLETHIVKYGHVFSFLGH